MAAIISHKPNTCKIVKNRVCVTTEVSQCTSFRCGAHSPHGVLRSMSISAFVRYPPGARRFEHSTDSTSTSTSSSLALTSVNHQEARTPPGRISFLPSGRRSVFLSTVNCCVFTRNVPEGRLELLRPARTRSSMNHTRQSGGAVDAADDPRDRARRALLLVATAAAAGCVRRLETVRGEKPTLRSIIAVGLRTLHRRSRDDAGVW